MVIALLSLTDRGPSATGKPGTILFQLLPLDREASSTTFSSVLSPHRCQSVGGCFASFHGDLSNSCLPVLANLSLASQHSTQRYAATRKRVIYVKKSPFFWNDCLVAGPRTRLAGPAEDVCASYVSPQLCMCMLLEGHGFIMAYP